MPAKAGIHAFGKASKTRLFYDQKSRKKNFVNLL
jgi:hypothetical protein